MDKYCVKQNDKFLCFPYRMQDGRALTDYRTSRVIYNTMVKDLCDNNSECCNDNNTYSISQCLQKNTALLMDKSNKSLNKGSGIHNVDSINQN